MGTNAAGHPITGPPARRGILLRAVPLIVLPNASPLPPPATQVNSNAAANRPDGKKHRKKSQGQDKRSQAGKGGKDAIAGRQSGGNDARCVPSFVEGTPPKVNVFWPENEDWAMFIPV